MMLLQVIHITGYRKALKFVLHLLQFMEIYIYRKNRGTKLRYSQKVNYCSLWWDIIMIKHYRLFHDVAILVILIAKQPQFFKAAVS